MAYLPILSAPTSHGRLPSHGRHGAIGRSSHRIIESDHGRLEPAGSEWLAAQLWPDRCNTGRSEDSWQVPKVHVPKYVHNRNAGDTGDAGTERTIRKALRWARGM